MKTIKLWVDGKGYENFEFDMSSESFLTELRNQKIRRIIT
jgi:hypothetical protein